MHRSLLASVPGVHQSSCSQQSLNTADSSISSCAVQWSLTSGILQVWICLKVQESLHNFDLVVLNRHVQGCLARNPTHFIHVRLVLHEHSASCTKALSRSVDHWSLPRCCRSWLNLILAISPSRRHSQLQQVRHGFHVPFARKIPQVGVASTKRKGPQKLAKESRGSIECSKDFLALFGLRHVRSAHKAIGHASKVVTFCLPGKLCLVDLKELSSSFVVLWPCCWQSE